MKTQLVLGLALTLIASSAAAAVITPGSDFDGAEASDVAALRHTVFGTQNGGTAQATAIGSIKRQPASSPDGSQSVTIEFARPSGTTFINGIIWSYDLNFMFTKSFMTNSGDTGSGVTKTVTFPASQLTNTSYLMGVAYMQPNVSVFGVTTN